MASTGSGEVTVAGTGNLTGDFDMPDGAGGVRTRGNAASGQFAPKQPRVNNRQKDRWFYGVTQQRDMIGFGGVRVGGKGA